jgi:hypothetical protein
MPIFISLEKMEGLEDLRNVDLHNIKDLLDELEEPLPLQKQLHNHDHMDKSSSSRTRLEEPVPDPITRHFHNLCLHNAFSLT